MLNRVRRRVAELLEEEVEPGRTRADVIVGRMVDAAVEGNVLAAQLVIQWLDEFDPTTESAWLEDDEA